MTLSRNPGSKSLVKVAAVVAARYHAWTALASPFADRRVDLYARDLGWRDPAGSELAYL